MLALIYLGLAICVGERLSGLFLRFVSTSHRWATGTLVGLVLSTGFTYQASRHFAGASNPLLWGDLLFFAAASIFLINCPARRDPHPVQPRVAGSEKWEWLTLVIYFALACWMMFATLNWKDGNIQIGVTQWSDYGPNTAIVQSFALGHNFPAEYPHFAGEPIRYHFLFYFQAGNLEFLGLNPVWSINLLSILTLVCLLALIMALGQVLFKSRAVGCLASALFFFHGTLNLVPFLRKQTSFKGALQAIYNLRDYLTSGYPYRGEDWGIWTQVVFLNQRHLASSIGIFLIVLIFLLDRYLEKSEQRKRARALAAGVRPASLPPAAATPAPPILPGDGQGATEDRATVEAQSSNELPSADKAPADPDLVAVSEAPSVDPVDRVDESSRPLEVTTPGDAQPSAVLEPVEQSLSAANYASAGEATTPDTIAADEPARPEPDPTLAGKIVDSEAPNTIGADQPAPPEPDTTLAGKVVGSDAPDPISADEPARPESDITVAGKEADSVATGSLKESAHEANEAADEETRTFNTLAYEQYMGFESQAALQSQVEEAEALEFAKQASQDRDTLPATEAEKAEQSSPASETASTGASETPLAASPDLVPKPSRGMFAQLVHDNLVSGRGFIFCGLLLGALPYWNAPVFTAAFAVLAVCFVLFPYRRYMLGLALTTAMVGLPQVLALRSGNARAGASLIHWGYTLGNVPYVQVLKYLGFTFGVKWLLILLALIFGSWLHWRLFIAIFSLFLLTFCFQFSEEALANHKFLNIWLVVANLFVAYGLWRLWHLRLKGWAIPSRIVALLLAAPIFAGGIIDFFPIHNATFISTAYTNDRLIKFLRTETKPDAIFLTDKFVNHPILLAGRRIWFGYTYFTWSAGYDLPRRETAYRQMFESKNAHQVFTLLKANGIDYVAFDSTIRGTFKNSNEQQVYVPNFKKVFEAADYWTLTIYKVPENADFVPAPSATGPGSVVTGVNVFEGGTGKENGQLNFPRGLAVDNAGNIFVSDTNNARIQRFSPTGVFLGVIGKRGSKPGEFLEPGGLAIDASGNIYVADVSNHRVQKLKADGTFVAEWKGPEAGFITPRDIAVGADNSIYVVDQGRSQVIRLDPDGKALAVWGTLGKEDGQFAGPTSVALDEKNDRVYVADPANGRIQVFDTHGKYISKWTVEQWVPTGWLFQDLAIDLGAGRLYASSPTDEILIFDLTGKKMGARRPNPPDKIEGGSSLALVKGKLYLLNTYGNRLGQLELETK